MIQTIIKVSSTSVNFTITGYASTKYAPGVPLTLEFRNVVV